MHDQGKVTLFDPYECDILYDALQLYDAMMTTAKRSSKGHDEELMKKLATARNMKRVISKKTTREIERRRKDRNDHDTARTS